MAANYGHLLTERNPPVCGLHVEDKFHQLTEREKLYAHYMSRAAFAGNRIILRQTSPEAETLFDLVIEIFHASGGDVKCWLHDLGLSEEEKEDYLVYAAMVLDNMGNYKSFGDSKFLPRLQPETFARIASISDKAQALYSRVADAIYSPQPSYIGYPEKGMVSTYYPESPGIKTGEVERVHEFLVTKRIALENTRLSKTIDAESGRCRWELLIASASLSAPADSQGTNFDLSECGTGFEGVQLHLVYGDYSQQLQRVAENLQKAQEYAANEHQKQMLGHYISSFETGSIEAHRASQVSWIRDTSPVVETNMGFIETYRDPFGVHAEWDGLVAIVNKDQSRKYEGLVRKSSRFIRKLPWNTVSQDTNGSGLGPFERQKFEVPDFTSLEILAYSTSQIWAGINIPNYDDIRQSIGFKNVSLANRLSAQAPREHIPFIPPEETETYRRRRPLAFQVAVAIHELIGHGSGLLLLESSPGEFNFNINNPPVNPLTNEPINSWYKPGQSYASVFGSLARTCEECRAECVATFLAPEKEILSLFGCTDGPGDQGFDEIIAATYLQMAYMGVCSLQTYDPELKKWGQAHERARFAILNQLLAHSTVIALTHSPNTLADLTIHVDETKILTEGRAAVGDLLLRLQIYASTADAESAHSMIEALTEVNEYWLQVREQVMQKRQPRKLFVQPNTFVRGDDDEEVVFRDYELSTVGIIQSWADRDI